MTSFCCLYCYNFKQIPHLLQLFLLLTLNNQMSTDNKFENQKQNYSWKFIDTLISFIHTLVTVNDWLTTFQRRLLTHVKNVWGSFLWKWFLTDFSQGSKWANIKKLRHFVFRPFVRKLKTIENKLIFKIFLTMCTYVYKITM